MKQRYYTPGLAIFVAACLTAICVTLSGCYTGYSYTTRPTTYKRSSTVPRRPVTYTQCDEQGCRTYDRQGRRRHDLERP